MAGLTAKTLSLDVSSCGFPAATSVLIVLRRATSADSFSVIPTDFKVTIDLLADVTTKLIASTYGSVYEISLFDQDRKVLSRFFIEMPDADALLSGLVKLTSWPSDGQPITLSELNLRIATEEQARQQHEDDRVNPHQVTAQQIGLGNVDNTSDVNKPVSIATQTVVDNLDQRIETEEQARQQHEDDLENPHEVTAEQLGLGNVDNTSDEDKPVSIATRDAIENLDEQLTADLINIGNDSIGRDDVLNTRISTEEAQRQVEDLILANQIGALANGATRAFLTYAELDAAKATLPPNSFARVTNDPTPANNWLWQWNGTVLTKSERDDLAQAKAYADANRLFRPVVLTASADFNTLTAEGRTVVPTNTIAAACTNRPSGNAGVLDVALVGSGVFQVYRVFQFDLAYERQRLSNGTWTDWVQSASKDMVDTVAANTLQSAVTTAALDADTKTRAVRQDLTDAGLYNYVGSSKYPFFADQTGKILLGYDAAADKIIGAGMYADADALAVTDNANALRGLHNYIGSSIHPVLLDKDYRVLLGYNVAEDKLIGAFDNAAYPKAPSKPLATALQPITRAINQIISYGQSLSVGTAAGSAISTTQPFSNVTFNGGVKTASDFSGFKPLIEDVQNAPNGDAAGETICSGAANYASLLAYRDNGVAPSQFVNCASACGRGSSTIGALIKSSAWYTSNFLPHLNAAKNLNTDTAIHAVLWAQGESDASALQTYQTYYDRLNQLQIDVEADAKLKTGQTSPVFFITYSLSTRVKLTDAIARAQFDLCKNNPKFVMATPTYFIPRTPEGTHMYAAGYKWLGAFYGRTYKQLVIDKIKPFWLEPLSVVQSGAVVDIKFDVPQQPLVFDTSALAATTDNGFKILDGAAACTIANMSIIGGDTVRLTLAAVPANAVVVRYGLDYLGAGLIIDNGASGNLRDSTAETVKISGVDYPMFYACPHFQMSAIYGVI